MNNTSFHKTSRMADSSEQDEAFALRNAASFFEKFERYECQELLGYNSSHWMLSSDDFKGRSQCMYN